MVIARTPVIALLQDYGHHLSPAAVLYDSLLRQYACHPELIEDIDNRLAELYPTRDLPGCIDAGDLYKGLTCFFWRHGDTGCVELNRAMHKVFKEVRAFQAASLEQAQAASDLGNGAYPLVDVTGGTKGKHADMLRSRERIVYHLMLDQQFCRFCAEELHDGLVLELNRVPCE